MGLLSTASVQWNKTEFLQDMPPDCRAVALHVPHPCKLYAPLPRLNIDILKILMHLNVEFN
jgi:hypothetical protein